MPIQFYSFYYALIKKRIDYDIQTKERMMFFLVYKQHLVHQLENYTHLKIREH